MVNLTICYDNSSVNIKSEDIYYSRLFNMYTGSRDGVGLQVNDSVNEAKIGKMCDKIALAIKEYLDV